MNDLPRATILLVFAAFASPCPAGARGGAALTIVNAGFESNPVATNCFQGFVPTGWSLYDPNGISDGANDAVGGLNTQPGGPYFINGAPEGEHVALVFLQGDIGGGPMGLVQTLGDVLEPDTYTLTVQVGNIASGQGPPPCDVFGFFDLDGFPGYRVQLLAGGIVIAEDDNTLAGAIPEGEFRPSNVRVTVSAGHPQLGASLAVRLINLNMVDSPADPGIEVDFDDVRLVRGCPATGDIDIDGAVDSDDAALLVSVLIGAEGDPDLVGRADVDCSASLDGADIQRFVELLLAN